MRTQDFIDYFALRPHLVDPWSFIRSRSRPPREPRCRVALKRGGALTLRTGALDRHILLKIFARDEYALGGIPRGALDTVIDIGAHIGIFAARAAPLARRVLSFEPAPDNFALLLENLASFPNVQPFRKAAFGERGTGALILTADPASHSLHRGGSPFEVGEVDVECITLADIFRENAVDRCGLLKLDCEGAEYEIIPSIPGDLWPRIDRVSLEYHPVLEGEPGLPSKGEDLKACLEAAGHEVRMVPKKKRPGMGLLHSRRKGLPL